MIHLTALETQVMALVPRMKDFSNSVAPGSAIEASVFVTKAAAALDRTKVGVALVVEELIDKGIFSKEGTTLSLLREGHFIASACKEWVIDHGKRGPRNFDELLASSEVLGGAYRDQYRKSQGLPPVEDKRSAPEIKLKRTPPPPLVKPKRRKGAGAAVTPTRGGSDGGGVTYSPTRGGDGKLSHARCGHENTSAERRACRKYAEKAGI